jgi:hypothetical protein
MPRCRQCGVIASMCRRLNSISWFSSHTDSPSSALDASCSRMSNQSSNPIGGPSSLIFNSQALKGSHSQHTEPRVESASPPSPLSESHVNLLDGPDLVTLDFLRSYMSNPSKGPIMPVQRAPVGHHHHNPISGLTADHFTAPFATLSFASIAASPFVVPSTW